MIGNGNRLAHSMRRFANILILCLLISAKSASADDIFIPQCPEMLPGAETFAQECLSNARSFSRVFYPGGHEPGEPETYSIYFKDASTTSHFALGCTLNRQHKTGFFGIYYSTDGNHFAKANTAPIRFVDAQGNVGLMIDGAPVTLLAVRQFESEDFPLRYPASAPKNCESPLLPNGKTADGRGQFTVQGDLTPQSPALKACNSGGACRDYKYTQFFKSGESQIFYHDPSLRIFVGTAGNVFVENEYYEKFCERSRHNNSAHTENIVTELCLIGDK
jgi:hypothetical protein